MSDWDHAFEERKSAAEAARQRRLAELRARDQTLPNSSEMERSPERPRQMSEQPLEMMEVDLPPWLKKLLDPTAPQTAGRPVSRPAPPPPPAPTPPPLETREQPFQYQTKKKKKKRPKPLVEEAHLAAPGAPAAPVSPFESKPVTPTALRTASVPALPATADIRLLLVNPQSLRRAVLLSEILSPPVSLR